MTFRNRKSNLNIVLVSESIRFVLSKPQPPALSINSTKEIKETYNRWITSNNRDIAYMLSSMNDTLWRKLELKEILVDILDTIQGMFGRKDELALI